MVGDEPADPPTRADGRGDESDATCDHCGSTIDTSEWYPVTKERDQDGSLRLYAFCSVRCRDEWRDERDG